MLAIELIANEMDDINAKRIEVLNFSLQLENLASVLLAVVFNRKDYKETKSFGSQSTSLSFNQKINLLLDYNAIEKSDKVKFDIVMSIRNQFLHNRYCTSYEVAFDANDGLENKLKKLYPEFSNIDEREKALQFGIMLAFEDCIQVFIDAKDKGGFFKKLLLDEERKAGWEIIQVLNRNATVKFLELEDEIKNSDFDYKDASILIDKILKLKNDIFDFSELLTDSE